MRDFMRPWLPALAACLPVTVPAEDLPPAGAMPVTDAALEAQRGGFDFPENLHAALRLERAAYVNGEQVLSLSVDIPDIAAMTGEQASALAHAAGTLVIQGGPNNTFSLLELGPASTVIQNTLNDQHLVAMTTLSVEVNSLSAFREMVFQDGLREGLGGIAGVR
jgi:hypothetical protein